MQVRTDSPASYFCNHIMALEVVLDLGPQLGLESRSLSKAVINQVVHVAALLDNHSLNPGTTGCGY